jgi:HAMP domain-containing protein
VFNLHKKSGTYQEIEKVANAMLSGQKGYAVTNINFPTPDSTKLVPTECYVYYRPFATRGWSACIVCPTDDILIGYDLLSHYFWLAIWISILLFLVACSLIIRWELKPLRNLKQWAQKVSAGQLDAPIPDIDRQDEIGQLKMSLEQMQQSLSAHVTELRTLTDFLEKQGDMLRKAYEQAREAERMKIALLHNMTDQMIAHIETLIANVTILREKSWKMEPYETALLVEDILDQGHAVTLLMDHLISVSQKKTNVKEQK